MSKRNKANQPRGKDGASGKRRQTEAAAKHGPRPRLLTPLKIGIGLGIIVLGGAALLRPAFRGRDGAARPGTAGGTTQPTSGVVTPVVASLPPPAPGTRVPLNDVDPVTGKPITPSSPTITYKGYVIAFCCADSEGYKGAWARMSESQKDAFVRRYLK